MTMSNDSTLHDFGVAFFGILLGQWIVELASLWKKKRQVRG